VLHRFNPGKPAPPATALDTSALLPPALISGARFSAHLAPAIYDERGRILVNEVRKADLRIHKIS
jgi:hypothetical protein